MAGHACGVNGSGQTGGGEGLDETFQCGDGGAHYGVGQPGFLPGDRGDNANVGTA